MQSERSVCGGGREEKERGDSARLRPLDKCFNGNYGASVQVLVLVSLLAATASGSTSSVGSSALAMQQRLLLAIALLLLVIVIPCILERCWIADGGSHLAGAAVGCAAVACATRAHGWTDS